VGLRVGCGCEDVRREMDDGRGIGGVAGKDGGVESRFRWLGLMGVDLT